MSETLSGEGATAVAVQRGVIRRELTPEQHRRALQRYLDAATEPMRLRCELESMMPIAFAKLPDGSLKNLERYGWPEWAVKQAAALDEILDIIKTKAFEDV